MILCPSVYLKQNIKNHIKSKPLHNWNLLDSFIRHLAHHSHRKTRTNTKRHFTCIRKLRLPGRPTCRRASVSLHSAPADDLSSVSTVHEGESRTGSPAPASRKHPETAREHVMTPLRAGFPAESRSEEASPLQNHRCAADGTSPLSGKGSLES